jgi:hypothetical protein
MIIAFSGVKFAGKDTAAEGLIRSYGFKRIGLADKLKDICSHVFGVPRQDMDNPMLKEVSFDTPISITNTNIVDLLETIFNDGFSFDLEKTTLEVCKNFYGKILTSIRDMLQTIGTDLCRTYIQDDIWLAYVKNSISNSNTPIVITDARFQNERDYLKSLGAILVLVKRPGCESSSTHISENQLGKESDYDVVIYNDNTAYGLQSSICTWYSVKHHEFLSNFRK